MKAKIKFLNAAKFLATSCGEVSEPSKLSYKTRTPKLGGLLCPKIFGPFIDYECNCNPPLLWGVKDAGVTCARCGVTSMSAKMRRERVGHIVLPSPCLHPLAYSIVADVIGISYKDLQNVVNGYVWIGWKPDEKGNIVLRSGIRANAVLKDQRDLEASKRSSMALYYMVKAIDIAKSAELRRQLGLKAASFLEKTVRENALLEDLFITILPMMPAAFRPYLDQGSFIITSSKNDLYTRIFWKITRFKRLRDLFPLFELELVLQEETTLLQKAVNELMIDGTNDVRGGHLKSITDDIRGKGGLIRNKLLGKRADFSGRSVISPGPWLKLDEMGLPQKMGVILFKPWIQRWLKQNYGLSTKQSDALYEKGKRHDSRLYEALEQVVKGKRLIMNRAPTLHRIGMLAFKIRLHGGNSCLLHPMVCAPYNADFDGDTMSVHIPLGKAVDEELDRFMMPEDNMLSPLDSSPVIGPSHEMVIGTYLMTKITVDVEDLSTIPNFSSPNRIIEAHERGTIAVNQPVFLLEDNEDENGSFQYKKRLTCAGRIMLERLFKVEITEPLSKGILKKLISESYNIINVKALSMALDKLKELAFKYVTKKGFSVGMDDFLIPSTRDSKMTLAQEFADQLKISSELGNISEDERVERKIRKWMDTIEELQDDFMHEAGENNPLVVMLKTGARVSVPQVSQLVVSKGMQARANGTIVEDPVKRCLMIGLDTYDYFNSSYGARKSMADKKMATPKSGYLARRLVNATRDLYISMTDCGNTSEGIELPRCKVVGRTTIEGVLIEPNESVEFVKVRSPVFCTAEKGICSVCYGTDFTKRDRIKVGEPAGIVAAQSLSEPATQMTMKTFHLGGSAELGDSPLVIRAAHDGNIKLVNGICHTEIYVNEDNYIIHNDFCKLLVSTGDHVKTGDALGFYTSKNLQNEDIGNKLDILNRYFELSSPKGPAAIIAKEAGNIELMIENSLIQVFINGELQGSTEDVPVFVHNGEYVRKGQFLSFGEANLKNFDDLELAANVFVNRMIELYGEEGINAKPVHLEMIFRGMSELVEDEQEPGNLGLYRFKDKGTRLLFGVTELGRLYPSWLKAVGFGYSKSVLMRAAINYAESYDLPTERIMMGEYPLFEPVEK